MSRWSIKDVEYLRTNYDNEPVSRLAKELNRSECAIYDKLKNLGLKHPYRWRRLWDKAPLRCKRMLTEEKAWMACAIDTDGSLTLSKFGQKRRSFLATAKVRNTRRELLDFAKTISGCGNVHKSHKGLKPKYKQCWEWVVFAKADARSLLEQVRPYLILKQRQADLLLELLNTEILDFEHLDDLVSEVRLLNKRGC